MTSRDFCYWLRGYIEAFGGEDALSAEAVQKVRKKLGEITVFDTSPTWGFSTNTGAGITSSPPPPYIQTY